ncbi:hypothetical protein [Tenuibacillus multivorans]|uniref:Uncharacterized protein n=1 Tax=Tenuibacillus multivorans TaxID=237069 RepID=A0A1H0ARB8_9BACI|nr:hypothetical protein [Tenuibacillus multivorans]GEL77852.1 hypothetical protein TMU01_20870 [Tenuibacillus multivorans]SDN36068.1 hypothetical protein SAMN05216498_2043 [Tenuibacillus multivorans]
MKFDGKKLVLTIIIIIVIMSVVTYAIFNYLDRNEYIEEMGMAWVQNGIL